ncbi:cysteine synthase A [Capnocytophaga haemolytica]|uniref:Cysteine synthase n=1 Tax=Capnocytophaga haemolytica TaxID=45243 RepID=A0AAX2GUP3_9FLAO|nr:cysteine synthase A [Capnocytophaga haemolytica]AMD85316.1 cysteine synthase [Capnocytophaga haemolytica]SFN61223.1 cysteine synthase A [Capnocytophaga haemolytica]SNV03156.1 Cysteine synthase [Capnocytophaga haemolytica]
MAYKNVLEVIGNTPEVKINRLFGENANVYIKLERLNPGGSIKDRIALAMIEDAEARGLLKKDTVIVEPTSGNTGVGLSLVAAVKGYKLIVVMPESMSVERRKLVTAYGAEIVLTPKEQGTGGAIAKAKEIAEGIPNSWIPQQFENPANPAVHERTTAQEILKSFPEGFDYFVTGVGTGGHISGISKVLKQHFPKLKTVAVEPDQSAVLSGGKPGPHALQGLGTGFVPKTYNPEVVDEVIPISKEEAYEFARNLAKKEGILAGISTGAALAAVSKVLQRDPKARILTVNYDTGERYWSVEGLYE